MLIPNAKLFLLIKLQIFEEIQRFDRNGAMLSEDVLVYILLLFLRRINSLSFYMAYFGMSTGYVYIGFL